MSGDTDGATGLEAAARRLAALADRLRAVRAQLAGTGAAPPEPGAASGPGVEPSGVKGEAR